MNPQAVSELQEVETELQESLAALPQDMAERLLEVVRILDDPEIKGALLGAD